MKQLREHSEVTNLELFYDLIFAYAISRITTVLHGPSRDDSGAVPD